MRLLIVNPNATEEMTVRIGAEARTHLPEWVELVLKTNRDGPASIQGAADGDAALPGTLALLRQTPFDVAIVGCFDDTGLAEMPEQKNVPLIGLGKSAFFKAHETGRKFAVLTTSALSVPVLEANIRSYSMDPHCVEVRASAIDVLDFETGRGAAIKKLIEAGRALRADHSEIETIVLGCAGMGGLAAQMQEAIGLEMIDPVKASIECAMSALPQQLTETTRAI